MLYLGQEQSLMTGLIGGCVMMDFRKYCKAAVKDAHLVDHEEGDRWYRRYENNGWRPVILTASSWVR